MKNEINATLKIPVHSEEQLKHIQKAEELLLNAHVGFHTYLLHSIEYWEWDFSLKGAELLGDKTLRFDVEAIADEELKYILLAEVELVKAGVVFKYGFDDFNHRLWMLNKIQGAELVVRK